MGEILTMRKMSVEAVSLKCLIPFWFLISILLQSCNDKITEFNESNVLNAPSDLKVTVNDQKNLTLSWMDNSNWEDGFIVQKSLNDEASFRDYAILSANTTSYKDSILADTKILCYYRIAAYKGTMRTASAVNVFRIKDILSPSNLTIENTTQTTIQLQWQDNSKIETGFVIQRSENNSAYHNIATVPANTITYSDTNLNTEYTYRYRVAALFINGTSDYSESEYANYGLGLEKPIVLDNTYGARSVCFIPGSGNIVAGGNEGNSYVLPNGKTQVGIFSSSGKLIRRIADNNVKVSVSLNGRYIATSGENYEIKVWDIETGVLQNTFRRTSYGYGMTPVISALSPDGKFLAFYDTKPYGEAGIVVYEVSTGNLKWSRKYPSVYNLSVLEYSPDGKQLIYNDNSGQLFSANALDGTSVKLISSDPVSSIAFSPSGKYLFIFKKGSAVLWDNYAGASAKTVNMDNTYSVSAIYFDPQNEGAYSYSYFSSSKGWNIYTGGNLWPVRFENADEIKLSPDGKNLLIRGNLTSVILAKIAWKWMKM